MAGQSPSAKSSTAPRHGRAWLSLVAVSILLVVVPTAAYRFFYREPRIQDATIRNLRALAAAADRVDAVMENLSTVVDGSSFGVSVAMLDELTERLTGEAARHWTLSETGCIGGNGGIFLSKWRNDSGLTDLLRLHEPAEQLSLEFRYRLAVRLLSESNKRSDGETWKLWNQLYCLLKKHRRYSAPVETINVDVNPLSGIPLRSSPFRGYCDGMPEDECDRYVRRWLGSTGCRNSTRTRRLSGGSMIVTDCRPLRERHRDLHDALYAWAGDTGEADNIGEEDNTQEEGSARERCNDRKRCNDREKGNTRGACEIGKADKIQAAECLVEVLDLFGIRSTAGLDELLTNATGHLSRFFDSHLIANDEGRILFEEEASLTSATETDDSHVATPAFSNHVDISTLLRVPPARGAEGGNGTTPRSRRSADDDGAARSSPELRRGESFVETMHIESVELRVFVQPFILHNVDLSGDSERNSQESRASQTFYIVGVVDSEEFRSDAIRLRLSLVINATLIVLVILTLCPLFWFWTVGDRLTIGPWTLAGVCATPVVGVVLFVVLACGMVTNRIDGRVLDDTMEKVAAGVVHLFDWELQENILELHHTIPDLQRDRNLQDTGGTDPGKLNKLEKKFYCDKLDRDLNYDHQENYREPLSIIGENGRQVACMSDERLARTPKLDLEFREYFKQPKEGALWRLKRADPPREVPCLLRMATDRESLIPCLIPGPIGSWRRWHVHESWPGFILDTIRTLAAYLLDLVQSAARRLAGTLSFLSSDPEVPYFLDRIDSVRGDVQTVLATSIVCDDPLAEAGCPQGVVAAIAVHLNSLDRAVPPPHVHYAVVDRRSGRTLFHSDDDLAMATNFAEDVGGDQALWTLLRGGASDTISLVYAGIPVRAHVRPLREGMPWALVVYRGHEIEDRLTSVTTALAAFFTLLPLFVFTILAGVVLFVAYLRKCAWVASFPICLGRVMAAGSVFRSVGSGFRRGAVTVLTLAFLVWIISWNPWRLFSFFPTDYVIATIVSLLAWWLFPYLAFGSVIAVLLFLAWCVHRTTGSNGYDAGVVRQALVVSLVIVFLGVVPAGLWFSHHRAALGAGLNHYLVDRTLESIDREREEYRLQKLREYGVGVAPRHDRRSGQPYVEHAVGANWIYAWLLDMLRPVVGLSRLSNDLMVYRVLLPVPAVGVASLYDVFAGTFDYDVRSWVQLHLGHVLLESVAWLLLAAALIGFIAHSIRTIVTRRHGKPMVDANECLSSDSGRPLRAVVLSWDPENRDCFIKKLIKARAFKCSYKYKWTGKRIQWELIPEQCSDSSKPLYVFDDLEKVLERSAEGRALFAELERKMDEESPVLVWSDVVHDYRYSERFGPVDAWFGKGSLDDDDDADRRRRWERLAGRLDPYLLGISHLPCSVSEFERLWGQSTLDERLELLALARGGVAGSRRPTARVTLFSLKSRGIVEVDGMGVVRWSCKKCGKECGEECGKKFGKEFSEFILRDADRQELAAWQKGRGGLWRVIWPSVLIGAALVLAFLFFANPEVRTTLLALLGILPALLALFRGSGVSGSANGE